MPRPTTSSRLAALFLGVLMALFATAAPAPVHKTKPPSVWFTAWGEPVDPKGGCRFERIDDRFTLFGEGGDRGLGLWDGPSNAPRLMRDIEGDFAMGVRIKGSFSEPGNNLRGAGIVLLSGANRAAVYLNGGLDSWVVNRGDGSSLSNSDCRRLGKKVAYLRLERRGQRLVMKASFDGREWETKFDEEGYIPLPVKVRVGVAAWTEGEGNFKVEFDQFEFTRSK